MSFIHYKLITNKDFEKVTFDGVSLTVFELKKIILEKKFRKNITPPANSSIPSRGNAPVNVTTKKLSDIDLEITNVDTNEGDQPYNFKFKVFSIKFFEFFVQFYFSSFHLEKFSIKFLRPTKILSYTE